MYSIGKLAVMAGVTRRTLHFYDRIGLLPAGRDPNNGYRRYSGADALRLQQIMLYRELDVPVAEIKDLLDAPNHSTLQALERHRERLLADHDRLGRLLRTVETTLESIQRGTPMTSPSLFDGFSPEKQEAYAQEAAERWDADLVKASNQRWNNLSEQERQAILDEGNAIYRDMADLIECAVTDAAVQAVVQRWHQHLQHFYQPSRDMLRGLADLCVNDGRFTDNIDRFGAGLAEFMNEAIHCYCDRLEAADD
ncbi:MerR family transcriptional regulator [Saccharospirillum salsuginis]|uniref:MerR family transcriptional regulator n=1 Tax=Saccharospirillum salsuginis TaxID=418750 RepID=A0A918NHL6_9GAMM|nr:MerR family transcriptional regulator [Saccharospirillum salsuginis]GGX68267.1 MerR family transcriptional regulator [Saccharospirillum salsuginis]